MTEKHSRDAQLTLLPEDSHARTSRLPATGQELPAQDRVYGQSSRDLLANYDLDSQLWKTSQRCFLEGWAEFLETYPKSGMTRNGMLYQQHPLARTTSEIERTFLPTPGLNEFKGSGRNRYKNSPHFRGAKMAEGLRTCQSDPIYTNPDFIAAQMGYPRKWAHMGTQSSLKSQNQSSAA